MKCVNCGADFQTSDLKCPYCGTQNLIGEEWKKERNFHENRYQRILKELKEYGPFYVINKILNISLMIAVAIFVVLTCIYATPSIVKEGSIEIKKRLYKGQINKQLQEYHETGKWDKLLQVMDEYELYGEDNYTYSQAAIIYRNYQNYLIDKMIFLDFTEEEKEEDDYHLEFAIKNSIKAFDIDSTTYEEIDPENESQLKRYQDEIRCFWENTLGFTEDEIRSLETEEYLSYEELDELVLKAKERKAWK